MHEAQGVVHVVDARLHGSDGNLDRRDKQKKRDKIQQEKTKT